MTDEKRLDQFDDRLHSIDKRQESFESFMKMYIQKTDQSLARHEEEMRELRVKQDADRVKHEADLKAIRTEIREDGKQTRRMLFANMAAWSLGLIAILIAIYLK